MTIGSKKTESHNYTLCQQRITSSESEKDLGIIVQSNLYWDEHAGKALKKANPLLGLISRCYENNSQNTLIPLYKSMIQPHLEYSVHVWMSYKQKDIESIEIAQRKATRIIDGLQSDPYHEKLKKNGLISLEMRRLRADLIEVFKMMRGLEGLSFESFFQVNTCQNTRGHSMKIDKIGRAHV